MYQTPAVPERRTGWEFPFSRVALGDATNKKLTYHKERVQHWTQEVAALEAEVKEKGLSFSPGMLEPGAAGLSNTYYQQHIVVDTDLSRRHQEAQGRLLHHSKQVALFKRWELALNLSNAPAVYQLTIDDVAFFFHTPDSDESQSSE